MRIENLSKETREKLQKLGIRIEEIFTVDCELCGQKIEDKNEEKLREKLRNHLDHKCSVAKYLTNFKPGTIMKDIGRYVELVEKLMKGKISDDEIKEFELLADRILKVGFLKAGAKKCIEDRS